MKRPPRPARARAAQACVAFAALLAAVPVRAGAEAPFAPITEVGVNTVADAFSNLTVRVTQQDGEALPRDFRIRVPAGWRFTTGIRTGNFARCADLPQVTNPTLQADAEFVGLARIMVHTDDTRDEATVRSNSFEPGHTRSRYAPGAAAVPAKHNDDPPGPARFGVALGPLMFHRWDATGPSTGVARLCGFVTTSSVRIEHDRNNEAQCKSRCVVFEILLELKADGSWDMSFNFERVPGIPAGHPDPRSLSDNPDLPNLSILEAWLSLKGVTVGNFQTLPDGSRPDRFDQDNDDNVNEQVPLGAVCAACQVPFVRTPTEPGVYTFRSTISTCRPAAPGCVARRVTTDFPIEITLPPTRFIHRYARLFGPFTEGIPHGFGLVRGSDSVPVTWIQPFEHPAEHLKGYVIAVAPPGDVERIHYEYLVTDPADPSFDSRQPCGPDGAQQTCTLSVDFPLVVEGPGPLLPDGKYDFALITVYQDGHRTDGLCDAGPANPAGIACPEDEPPFLLEAPPANESNAVRGMGISTWQLLIRSRNWPLAFVENQQLNRSGLAGYQAPAFLLFVDFAARHGEFVRWNPLGREESFFAASSAIQGDGRSGTVSFGSPPIVTTDPSFRFEGLVNPGGCPTRSGSVVDACGVFLLYRAPGTPGPPSGVDPARLAEDAKRLLFQLVPCIASPLPTVGPILGGDMSRCPGDPAVEPFEGRRV